MKCIIFIEWVDTENSVDDLSQDQQQKLESQHQTVDVKTVEVIVQEQHQLQSPEQLQLMSSDSLIKMVDIHKQQALLEWSVISEIEGTTTEPVADFKINYGMMESERIYDDSTKNFDTFRGGTKSLFFDASAIIFQESDDKTMETIMFGAQTANKFQSNSKYQDDMKGNPISGVKRKTRKSVKSQIEEDNVLEAYVTHWQELETKDRVEQRQEQEKQDHNFRHGSENSSHEHNCQALDQQRLGWQECDGGVKEWKPSTHCPSQFSQETPCHH